MTERLIRYCVAALAIGVLHGHGRAAEPVAKPLPKVLILGDSISLGYTPVVRKLLEGKAEVLRPRENCQHTAVGLAKIKGWLGTEKWDVIHFNWGIWDTHMLDEQGQLVREEEKPGLRQRHSPEQYRANLTELVKSLKATGARLVWAQTTPIMRRKGDRFEAIPKLNAEAAAIMKAGGVAINDLYEFVLPHAAEWQGADRVHFNAVGNELLGKRVSEEIVKALQSTREK